MGQYAPRNLEPQNNDSKITLLRKLLALFWGMRTGDYPMQTAGGGGGGGATADNSAANGLTGLKAIDTAGGEKAVRDYVMVDFGSANGCKTYILRSGNTDNEPDQVLPNDHDDGTNNVFWEVTST